MNSSDLMSHLYSRLQRQLRRPLEEQTDLFTYSRIYKELHAPIYWKMDETERIIYEQGSWIYEK